MGEDEIKKVIESCHLNFLIGSGASVPFFTTLGSIETQLTALSAKSGTLPAGTYAIVDSSLKQTYYTSCIENNVKILTSDLSAKAVQAEYDRLLFSLHTILIKRINNLVSKQVNLFTTNMDLFLDWSLEKQNLSFNDGFSGRLRARFGTVNFHNTIRKTSSHYDYQSEVPHFNLFKLHGSVNWKLENNEIEYDHSLSQLQKITSKKLGPADILDDTSQELAALVAAVGTKGITKNSNHDDFLTEYNKLVMINPTKEKFETTTRQLTFYELLRMYSNHLERENSVLFVIGFSFADEHIREITKRVAAANPTLLIVVFAYNAGAQQSIKDFLTDYPNIKYCFDSTGTTTYSMKTINDLFFSKIAIELNKEGLR
jgi:hemerythrin